MVDYADTMKQLLALSQRPAAMLSDLHIDGTTLAGDARFNDIVDDSRQVRPGCAYLCLPRAADSADAYVSAAASAGASAVICAGCRLEAPQLPVLSMPDLATAGSVLRRWFACEHEPSLVGITGTDGKTSCAWMLREALERLRGNAWSAGTLGWVRGEERPLPLPNTTPSLLIMHRLLAAAAHARASALVCEVSAHGIDQGRIAGLPFAAGLWTTLGHDHLQDFGGFEGYAERKAAYLNALAAEGKTVVANADDPAVMRYAPRQALRYGVGLERSDVALAWQRGSLGELLVRQADRQVTIRDVPAGDFHAENLAAVALILSAVFEVPLASLPDVLSGMSSPPGRMQAVAVGARQVFIDYAHTPEALERCLVSARPMTAARLLLVFGCGGERSREKRPLMGRIASDLADVVWVTSDNPRGEEPSVIAAEIVEGMKTPHHAEVRLQLDRGRAISEAIDELAEGDVLIIAGKGHEREMVVAGRETPWNDYEVADRLLHEKHRSDTRACA